LKASVALAGQTGGAVRVVLELFGSFFFQEKKGQAIDHSAAIPFKLLHA